MAQPRKASDDAAEEAAERIRRLNERIIEESRKGGLAYLDAYEQALSRIADFGEQLAKQSGHLEWINELANAQATFLRDFTRAYTNAARELLK